MIVFTISSCVKPKAGLLTSINVVFKPKSSALNNSASWPMADSMTIIFSAWVKRLEAAWVGNGRRVMGRNRPTDSPFFLNSSTATLVAAATIPWARRMILALST